MQIYKYRPEEKDKASAVTSGAAWSGNTEDVKDGMCFPDTHRHNTEVAVAGITLARVVEIINNYTVTFEDGQYLVTLYGANSNIPDVVNFNQVSVRAVTSAGLTGTAFTTTEQTKLMSLPTIGKMVALLK